MRRTNIAADPFKALYDTGRVAFGDGRIFGDGGEGFIRINFGCPRSILMDGLERIRKTLDA